MLNKLNLTLCKKRHAGSRTGPSFCQEFSSVVLVSSLLPEKVIDIALLVSRSVTSFSCAGGAHGVVRDWSMSILIHPFKTLVHIGAMVERC